MSVSLHPEMTAATLNTFCKDAVAAGPIALGRRLAIMGNTYDKEIAVLEPLPIGTARPYLDRCGQRRVLYHDTEDRYWDILYTVATRTIISVEPWSGPQPPEEAEYYLNAAFCVGCSD
jgi:hypothetical protein